MERRNKKAQAGSKEAAKLKKQLKSNSKEINSFKNEIKNYQIQNEDYRSKIEEMVKKSQGSFNSRPTTSFPNQSAMSAAQAQIGDSSDTKKLKQELGEKDNKIKELNGVVSQLQTKLQEKMNELSREQNEKEKFKDLYSQYQDEVARLQNALEDGEEHPKFSPPEQKASMKAQRPEDKKLFQKQQQDVKPAKPAEAKKLARIEKK